MRSRRQATIRDLRLAIDCLPSSTRVAMLEGIRSNDIIVGAYTDGGGICPMLAAHRAGGRTSFIQFAKAWDRVAFRGAHVGVARRATDRELLILTTHLEASLLDEELATQDLAAAVADHRSLLERRGRRAVAVDSTVQRPRPGDRDRSRELKNRPGWAWMRVFRRYEDYERALERLHSEHEALERRRERELVHQGP
jgi:hypothetical protein